MVNYHLLILISSPIPPTLIISEDRPKLILFWTTFYGHVDFEFGLGRRPFEEHRCSVTNCETTADRSRLGQADVVVFHLRNMRNMVGTDVLLEMYLIDVLVLFIYIYIYIHFINTY